MEGWQSLWKWDAYPASGSTSVQPHAVSGITGTVNGVVNPTYTYDANGNMTAGDGRTITPTAFNMAASVVQSGTTIALTYDSEHNRITQTMSGGTSNTTTYLNDPTDGAMSETFLTGGVTTWRDYIVSDNGLVAERFNTGGTIAVDYVIVDHLGSTGSVTGSTGTVTERNSFDAWGLRRNANGTDAASCNAISSAITRGFTGQESIDPACAINFNARLYDPSIARFLGADSMVPSPLDGQSFNRFSYVGNNPLDAIDPSGHVWKTDGQRVIWCTSECPTGSEWRDTTDPNGWSDPNCIVCESNSTGDAQLLGTVLAPYVGRSGGSYVRVDIGPDPNNTNTFPANGMEEATAYELTAMQWVPDFGTNLNTAFQTYVGLTSLVIGGPGFANLVSHVSPTRGTVQIGIAGGFFRGIPHTPLQWGGIGGVGIAVDTHLGVAVYGFPGAVGGAGASAGGGLSIQLSDALTVDDLRNGFYNGSFTAGDELGGSIDVFHGGSVDGPVWGGGFTVGSELGLSAYGGATDTFMCSTSKGC